MSKNNKGFTLTEVIVAMIILVILFISVITAFNSLRKVNTTSSNLSQCNDLANTIIEDFYSVSYDSIKNGNVVNLVLPSAFDSTSATYDAVVENTLENGMTQKTFKIKGIEGKLAEYEAEVTLTQKPDLDTEGNAIGFTDFTTTTKDSSVILNLNKNTFKTNLDGTYTKENDIYVYDNEYSYDDDAIDEFISRNISYVTKLYNENCAEINAYNEKYNTNIPLPILGEGSFDYIDTQEEIQKLYDNTNQYIYLDIEHGNVDTITLYLKYVLYENDIDKAKELLGDNNEFVINLYTNYSVLDLHALFLLFPTTNCKEMSLEITNGTNLNNSSETGIFLVNTLKTPTVGDLYTKQTLISNNLHTNNKFKTFIYNQGSNDSQLCNIYTNVSEIYNTGLSSLSNDKKQPQIYELSTVRNRLYDIKVTVRKIGGVSTFVELEKSNVVLK